jgi:hypothetical protein
MALPEAHMAREAVLCIRQDGVALNAVAAAAKTTVQWRRLYLDQCEPTCRSQVLSAQPGELLGPLPSSGTFVLLGVLQKRAPVLDDPATRQRAEHAVLDRTIDHAIARRVRWCHPGLGESHARIAFSAA